MKNCFTSTASCVILVLSPEERLVRVTCLTVFIVAALLLCSSVFAGEPSSEPVLRLETVAHTGRISRMAVDGEGKHIVSASFDKTVRVWDSRSGKLLSVFRPPIGEGLEGELYAMALSPDGKTIACSGSTGTDWGERSIYLFDVATGRLQRRLTAGLKALVLFLAYSRDGRYLAALQPYRLGLALYRTSDGKLVGQDFSYFGRTGRAPWMEFLPALRGGSIDFAPPGKDGIIHFVTASEDGYIRLYEIKDDATSPSFRSIKHEKARSGNRPQLVRYSPDGTMLAVGYGDVHKVDVMSARDLSYLYSPDTTGVTGDIPLVQWSRDGTALYCGGGWRDARDTIMMRRWLDRGKGTYHDIVIGQSRVTDMVSLPNGVVVAGTHSGWMMAVDGSNKVRPFSGVSRPDFTDNPLYLSSDGATIRFGFQRGGKSPVIFSFPARALTTHDPGKSKEKLSGPITQAADISVTDWKETKEPMINGKRIRIYDFETSYCFALTPDRQGIVHGTSRYLRLLTSHTEEKWKVPAPGTVLSVTVSPDGRVVVAAFSNGTISWFRTTDGKLLLSLFAHGDRKRWVVWSPSGYYDCSEGADELLGWHVNNGKDHEAFFYPLARFFERYFRPDVITTVITRAEPDSKVIASMKEAAPGRPTPSPGKAGPVDDARTEAPILKLAQQLPPQVGILSPGNGATLEKAELQVIVEARDMGGGVGEVRLFHNGKRVPEDGKNTVIVQRGKNLEKTYNLTVLEGENVLMAVALSKDAIEGNPAEITVATKGESKAPDLHLVLIGIDSYRNPELNLNFAGPDTASIKDFFTSSPARRLFPNVHVYMALNEKATKAGVTALFDELKERAQQKDVIVLYMAGHGDMVGSEWFFIPYDVTTPEEESLVKKLGISAKEITEALRAFKAQKIFVVLDACKSGGLISGMTGLRGYEDRKVMKQLVRSTGTYVVSASTDKQYAAELKELSHGVLTYTMLEGLQGKAGGGKVTVEGLIQYVKERLPELTEKYRGAPQWPVSWGAGMDFPLALY